MEQVEPTRSLFLLLLLFRAPAATLPLPCSLARGATSCIHSARLSPPRGVAWSRPRTGGTRNFWISTSLVLFPAHARANTQESIARAHVLWSLWLLARNDGHDHGCP